MSPNFCAQTKKTKKQKKKQTVTDISPACLSACGDNKTYKVYLSVGFKGTVGFKILLMPVCGLKGNSPKEQ